MNGNNLYNRRKELGLTLEEVGNIVGVSKSTVRKWETGYIENMKRDKIALLAKALKTSPLYIMGIEDNLNKPSADLVVDMLSDEELLKRVKRMKELSNERQQTIYDTIDYWYEKEGH